MNFLYVKTYLYLYPHMKTLEEDLARSVELKAALSYRMRGDAFTLATRIADELFLKERIIGLRETLEKIMDALTDGERELLKYKYFRKRGIAEKPTIIACSERQYFRLQQQLISKIRARLMASGYNEADFFSRFGDYLPFKRVYHALEEGRAQEVIGKRSRRPLVFCQNSSAGAGRLPRRTSAAIAMSATPTAQITITCLAEGAEVAGAGGAVSTDGAR